MAKIRIADKEKIVENLAEKFKSAEFVGFVDYKGLPVTEINQLRKDLRASDSTFSVMKFTLLKKAAELAKKEISSGELKGKQLAAIFSAGDSVAPSKILHNFGKTHETFTILGGLVDGLHVDTEAIVKLAKLPSRDELIGKAVGSIVAPLRNFVGVLSANLRNIVYVLNSIREAKS